MFNSTIKLWHSINYGSQSLDYGKPEAEFLFTNHFFFCFLSPPDPLKYWGTFFQASFFCSCGLECHRMCSLCLQHRGRAITAHLKKLAWVFTVTEFHGMLTGKAVTAGKLAVICGWPLLCWEVKCMHPWACSVKVDGLPQLWASLGRSQCDRRR